MKTNEIRKIEIDRNHCQYKCDNGHCIDITENQDNLTIDEYTEGNLNIEKTDNNLILGGEKDKPNFLMILSGIIFFLLGVYR